MKMISKYLSRQDMEYILAELSKPLSNKLVEWTNSKDMKLSNKNTIVVKFEKQKKGDEPRFKRMHYSLVFLFKRFSFS